jgi:hypothetical protein
MIDPASGDYSVTMGCGGSATRLRYSRRLGELLALLHGKHGIGDGIAVEQVDVFSSTARSLERAGENLLQGLSGYGGSGVSFRLIPRACIEHGDSESIDILRPFSFTNITVVQFKQEASDPLAPFIHNGFNVLYQRTAINLCT